MGHSFTNCTHLDKNLPTRFVLPYTFLRVILKKEGHVFGFNNTFYIILNLIKDYSRKNT